MKIVIAGGTGFIGRHLLRYLSQKGHLVMLLSRQTARGSLTELPHVQMIQWDGLNQGPWAQECRDADAVINLCGAPIADARWTEHRKQTLVASRVQSTRTLLEAIKSWARRPQTFLTASGIGFYGDTGGKVVDESSPPGKGFLPELCQAWEGAALEGEALGLRVIPIRTGMVLGPEGGALSKMTPPFRMGMGGPILPGNQFVSWIHREDLARLMLFVISHPEIKGPVNAVAPNPVTMKEFCSALGKALGRPSWLPVPAFALKIALGELSTMLTTGQRVHPPKTLAAGFSFVYPTITEALNAIFASTTTAQVTRN